MSVSLSASVAMIGVPMFTAAAVFSATERVTAVPSVNTGAVLILVIIATGRSSDLTSA